MNIVLDSNVRLDSQSENYLKKLLHNGASLLVLDGETGKLIGTPNKNEGMLFITDIPVDVMKYHGDFFRNFQNAPQWFFVVYGDNSHGVTLLKKAEVRYNLNNCRFYYAPGSSELCSVIDTIADENIFVIGKTLLFSKHKRDGGETEKRLAEYLFEGNADKYEIAYQNIDGKTDAGLLVICGEEERDFKKIDVPEVIKPFFVVTNPEKHLQQYFHPEKLIELIAAYYDMTPERVRTRLYFVSTVVREWQQKRNTGNIAAQDGLLLWDRFGLPISRKEYTAQNIESFLGDNYFDGEKLRQRISQTDAIVKIEE